MSSKGVLIKLNNMNEYNKPIKIHSTIRFGLLLLVLFVISCKNEEQKQTKNTEITKNTDSIYTVNANVSNIINNNIERTYYYGNNKKAVYKTPSLKEKIDYIGTNSSFDLISFTGKYDETDPKNIREWIKISYISNQNEKKEGYVLNENINFKNVHDYSNISRDTAHVNNEEEFLKALSSNRVIYIKAKELNFQAYINNNKNLDFVFNTYSELQSALKGKLKKQGYFVDRKNPFLVFYGYENLIIKSVGRNTTLKKLDNPVQLEIYQCKNLFFENITIEGDTSNKEYQAEDFEDYVVTHIENSSYIYFNNAIINGFNNSLAKIIASNNIYFTNSRFNKISNNGISCTNGTNISIKNCYFVNSKDMGDLIDLNSDDGDNSNINISNTLINNNILSSIYSTNYNNDVNHSISLDSVTIKSNYFENGFLRNVNSSYTSIDNCNITNNMIKSPFFTVVNPKIYIYNSKITQNTSVDTAYFFDHKSGYINLINLNNTKIENNRNFLAFTDNKTSRFNEYFRADKNSSHDNIYLSDTTLTKHNKIIFSNKNYQYINYKNVSTDEDKTILYNNTEIKDGFYSFEKEFSNGLEYVEREFFDGAIKLPLNEFYFFYGEVKKGKLNGSWRIINNKNATTKIIQEINYRYGKLQGLAKKYIIKNKDTTLIEKGRILDNKKQGEWLYYYPNGNLCKKENFKDGKQTGTFTLYYIDGSIMDYREHYYYKEGKSSFYYPNGQLESEVVYKDGKPIIEESKFYNESGNQKNGSLLYKIEQRKGLPYKVDINFNDEKYKNNSIIKKRSYFGYFQQASQLKNSKPFGVQRYEVRTELWRNKNIVRLFNVEFIKEDKLKSNKYVFFDNFDIYQTWLYNSELNKMVLTQYDGVFNSPQLIQHYIQQGDSLVKDGVYKKLTKLGDDLVYGNYKKGKKVGTWFYYNKNTNNAKNLIKKEVYKNDKLITTQKQ